MKFRVILQGWRFWRLRMPSLRQVSNIRARCCKRMGLGAPAVIKHRRSSLRICCPRCGSERSSRGGRLSAGTAGVAKSAPDGYTHTDAHIERASRCHCDQSPAPFDPVKDFASVSRRCDSAALSCRPISPQTPRSSSRLLRIAPGNPLALAGPRARRIRWRNLQGSREGQPCARPLIKGHAGSHDQHHAQRLSALFRESHF